LRRSPTSSSPGSPGRAEHTLQEDGARAQRNVEQGLARLHRGHDVQGRPQQRRGQAKVSCPSSPSYVGDYWMLYVYEDYQYALVGEPRRKNLSVSSFESPFVICDRSVEDSVCACINLLNAFVPSWFRFCAGRRRCTASFWRRPKRRDVSSKLHKTAQEDDDPPPERCRAHRQQGEEMIDRPAACVVRASLASVYSL
jgi:hypothetical protein